MPVIPSWLLEPLWDQFAALLPDRPVYAPSHPLGCHRLRIADRIIFEKLIQVLRFGCSYESIADCTCGATTIRERRDEWIKAGIFANLINYLSARPLSRRTPAVTERDRSRSMGPRITAMRGCLRITYTAGAAPEPDFGHADVYGPADTMLVSGLLVGPLYGMPRLLESLASLLPSSPFWP